jgi:hypothetical protein
MGRSDSGFGAHYKVLPRREASATQAGDQLEAEGIL